MTPANNNLQNDRASQQDLGFKNPYFRMGVLFFFGGLLLLLGGKEVLFPDTDDTVKTIIFYVLSILIFAGGLLQIIHLTTLEHTKTMHPRMQDDIVDPKTGKPGLWFDDIPEQMVDFYDDIRETSYRLFSATALSTVRTFYLRTSKKGKNSSKTSNNFLLIEHQFAGIGHGPATYIYIKPDKRNDNTTHLGYFLVWPGIAFSLLLPGLFDYAKAMIEASARADDIRAPTIEPYDIDGAIILMVLAFFAGYINYLVQRKRAYRHAVVLEKRTFEKEFDVDSNDPIIARQICNPSFMEKIGSWLQKHDATRSTEIYIDFSKNRILYKFDYLKSDYLKTERAIQPITSETDLHHHIQLSREFIQELGVKEHMDRIYLSHHLHQIGIRSVRHK